MFGTSAHRCAFTTQRSLAGIALAVLLICALPAQATERVAPDIDEALAATVFIRVDRLHSGRMVTSNGTGFLIHRDGWIVTNAHVVADAALVSVGGEQRRARAKVQKVTVVLHSGRAGESEVEARVVARETGADLALLKIQGPHEPVIDIFSAREPTVTEHVWVIGFPFGELLSMKRFSDDGIPNPVPSVNQGRVSALRRDERGRLGLIQTDASVNPGNSGGPMVDADGRLLGMISSRVGSGGVGFAISAAQVRVFAQSHGYRIRFQPQRLTDRDRHLVVRVESGLGDLSAMSGAVSVGGGSSPERRIELASFGRDLQAIVELAPTAARDAAEGNLVARFELRHPTGSEPITRLFRIPGDSTHVEPTAIPTSAEPTEVPRESGQEPLGLGGGLFNSAGEQSAADRRLMARRLKAVGQNIRFDEAAFAALSNSAQRDLAVAFERSRSALYRTAYRLTRLERPYGKIGSDLQREANTLLSDMRSMLVSIKNHAMCRCAGVWVPCDTRCDAPVIQPWQDADLIALQEWLRR